MSGIIEDIDYGSLHELRHRRKSGRRTLSNLSEELDFILAELKTKTKQLKTLNTEHAVTERQIKAYRNEIFETRKRCAEIEEGASHLHKEFLIREKQQARLKTEDKDLSERIAEAERESREVSSQINTLEGNRQNLSKRFKEQKAVKQEISDEISEALSKTSLDREEIEPRLMALNKTFMDHIGRRSDIQMLVSEREAVIKGLEEAVGDLLHQIEDFEQLKAFKKDRDAVKDVNEKIRVIIRSLCSKLEALEEELERKQDEFDELSGVNEKVKNEIDDLEDAVAEYDEAATERKRAQDENERTREKNNQGREALLAIYKDRVELETVHLMMGEKIRAVAALVESME
ncbi:MAG TPA: hypothetical protein HPQ03_05530 [Deltaproteobacteria bacterium]|nr:hypothetical protein [Deltaproteobacteria bacterium]